MAKRKPSPSAPMRRLAGMRTSSKITWRVGCEFQPIFFSLAPKLTPLSDFSTMKAEMPLAPSPPVRAITT